MDKAPSLKTVFEYDDYRIYLRDYYFHSKATNKNFSYRYFAKLGDFKSPNILKIVIDGKINIVPETIDKFSKAMKLNKEESAFFKNLVLFNQATSSEEKQKYSQELIRSRTFKRTYPLSEAQYHYFDRWYFPIVRGLVNLTDFKEDPEWIAKKINPPITTSEARKALEELINLGLLSRNESGKLVQTNPTVVTTNAITSSSLAQYHKEMMKKAAESIDRIPRNQRDLSALSLGLSSESATIIKEMIEKFRRDILEVASKDQGPNSIYQLNIYLFPITKGEDEGESS